jgi:hypothetical protein
MTQVISLRGGAMGAPILSERLATSIISPGALVIEAAGEVDNHGTAAGNAQRLFAQKNLSVAGDVDTAYAIGETVCYGAYHSGQEVSALVAAGAAAIVDGDALESDGDGTLRVVTTAAATADTSRDSIVGYALEDVDNSGGGTVVRIKIRVA